jgi:DNA-binding FadR family transcriptional regulator
MRQAAEAGRFSPEDDRALHQVLYENVDNLVVGKLLDICWEVFFQAKKRGPVPEIRDPMASYRSHAALVEALEKGDEEAMRAAVARHYEGIRQRLERVQQATPAPEQQASETR